MSFRFLLIYEWTYTIVNKLTVIKKNKVLCYRTCI